MLPSGNEETSERKNTCVPYADRHFPKIVKLCLEHPEICKSVKTGNLNFSRKKFFHLIFTGKIRYRTTVALSEACQHKSHQVNHLF